MHKINRPRKELHTSATSFRCAIGGNEYTRYLKDSAYFRAVFSFNKPKLPSVSLDLYKYIYWLIQILTLNLCHIITIKVCKKSLLDVVVGFRIILSKNEIMFV